MHLIERYHVRQAKLKELILKDRSSGVYIGFLKGRLCLVDYTNNPGNSYAFVTFLKPTYSKKEDTVLSLSDSDIFHNKESYVFNDFMNGLFFISEEYTGALTSITSLLKEESMEAVDEVVEQEIKLTGHLTHYYIENSQIPPKGLYFFIEEYSAPTLAYVTDNRMVIDLCYGQIDIINSDMLDDIYSGQYDSNDSYFIALPRKYVELWDMYDKYLKE